MPLARAIVLVVFACRPEVHYNFQRHSVFCIGKRSYKDDFEGTVLCEGANAFYEPFMISRNK